MIYRETCAHCQREFTWNDVTPRICNRCFMAGVDPDKALAVEAERLELKAAMAAVQPGLHVKVYDEKKWKALGRELKRGGLVLKQALEDGWMLFVPPPSKAKTYHGKCYVCAPTKCRHAHPLHSGCSSMSKAISDAEARRVVVPGYTVARAGSDSYLTDVDKTIHQPLARYAEEMGGCEPCSKREWCDVHPGATTGRDERTGEWFGREEKAA